ncbi:TPA: hypothetical protein VMY21_001470 [Streptococcus pyogenes]|nr:hypothetical protein [Streptococcus pyogenes]
MKTRSKRFLNLATLCLALLSTTLLTTQPVKAEVTRSNQTHITTKSYEDSRKQGTDDGYEKGKKAASDETLNARDIVVPGGFDTQGYMDGYEGGFWKGFNEVNHPIMTAIEGFFSWLWDLFIGE